MTDLFGNEREAPSAPAPPATQLELVDAAAEKNAIATGRPVSQERIAILYGPPD